MPLNFPNISTLSIQQQSRFFQAGFNYSNTKSLRINGLLTDPTNSFGVTGIWTGISTTNKAAIDYQPLIINDVNFGSGRITSITYDQGNDVRLKNYTATIEILDSGNLFNLTGAIYNGVDFSNAQYLENFSENWNFAKKTNGGYTSNHTASITFTTGVGNLNAIEAAKSLAKTLFTGSNLGFAFYSGYSNRRGKRFFNESYNLIDKSCSFAESFDFNADDGLYSAIRNHSVNLDTLGIISVSERAIINGIENINYQNALAALNTELTGTYFRCSGVSTYYFPTGATLINAPLSQSRSFDLFTNNLSYEINYSTNPANSGTYFWDYTQQVSRADGIGIITENGSLIGRGANPTTSFSAAQNGFLNVKSSINSRITSSFSSSFGSSTNFLQGKSESYSPLRGEVSYNYQYSNDPALIANSGIRRKEVTIENNNAVHAYNRLNIFNFKEIAQDDRQSTVAASTVNVQMEGDKTIALPAFLTLAASTINSNIPTGTERYVGDASYVYNKNENSVNGSLTWIYNRAVGTSTYPQ